METKHGGADLPLGQRLALERNCDKWGDAGIVLVMRNQATNLTEPTYRIASLPVVEYRYKGKWIQVPGAKTCLWWIETFASKKLGREVKAANKSDASNDEWIKDYEAHEKTMLGVR